MIVLCDRFPQSHQVGNDGPCLGHWIDHSSWVRRTVAREELAALKVADRLRPDLIIKLNIAADVALQRKPDTPPAMLHTKLRVLEQWRVAEGTRIVEIDATLPFERVLLEVKRAIWSAL
jgi:thymidylate kinase